MTPSPSSFQSFWRVTLAQERSASLEKVFYRVLIEYPAE